MKTFIQFISEMKKPKWKVPKEPGTKAVKKGHVRLYHQTGKSNLSNIRRKGIKPHQPTEGPRGIYADEKGFYGDPKEKPTAEFSVKKKDFSFPFVHKDKVKAKEIIATHKDWHETVRYIQGRPGMVRKVLAGEYDDLMDGKSGAKYSKAIRFIKKRAAANKR